MTDAMQKMINRLPDSLTVTGNYVSRTVRLDGVPLSPVASQSVYNHSPDGFAWGYTGSGPAQLALAILLTVMSREEAQEYYQAFKNAVVSKWPQKTFAVTINMQEMITNILTLQYEHN